MRSAADLILLAVTAGLTPVEIRHARMAYHSQKSCARRRGIRFTFTFEHWLAWWRSNEWPRRGRGGDCLVMARLGDRGAYAPGNVYLSTFRDNGRSARPQLRLALNLENELKPL